MKTIDLIRLSWANLRGNSLRTFLTIVGVGIGIGAIYFLVGLGYGLQKLTVENITHNASLSTLDVLPGHASLLQLDPDTLKKLAAVKGVTSVSGLVRASAQVKLATTITDTIVNGIDETYPKLAQLALAAGRFPKAKDEVALSTAVLSKLGVKDPTSALDQTVTLTLFVGGEGGETGTIERRELSLHIVGVVDEQDATAYSTADALHEAGLNNASLAKVYVSNTAQIDAVKSEIEGLGFSVTSMVDLLRDIQAIFRIIEVILAGFGVIALLVAAIGMFNTMTIALLERIRDVGIMKALGASRSIVMGLFLVESVSIGLCGGIVGVTSAYGVSRGITFFIAYLARRAGAEPINPFFFPIEFTIGILAFSLITGFITGFYPSLRAGRLNPLMALRYE